MDDLKCRSNDQPSQQLKLKTTSESKVKQKWILKNKKIKNIGKYQRGINTSNKMPRKKGKVNKTTSIEVPKDGSQHVKKGLKIKLEMKIIKKIANKC